jgi:hypothetical protein
MCYITLIPDLRCYCFHGTSEIKKLCDLVYLSIISSLDWIGLAKDRNRWRALVNSVLNLRVP